MNPIKFDKDRLNNADFRQVGMGGMAVISRLQTFKPEVRILALAAVFATVCEVFKVRPVEAMEIAQRVAREKSVKSDELRAVNIYINKESKR